MTDTAGVTTGDGVYNRKIPAGDRKSRIGDPATQEFLRSRGVGMLFPDVVTPTVSLLVPTLQGGRRLSRLLASIRPEAEIEIVVLSGPGAAEPVVPKRLRSVYRGIRSRKRLWTAEALSALLDEARGRFVLYLNDDAVLRPGAVAALAAHARDNRSLTGKILDLAAPSVLQSTGILFRSGAGAQRGFGSRDDGRAGGASSIFGVGGPMFLYPRKEIQAAGGFDTSLVAYHEDTDLAIRFRGAGGTATYIPSAVALHEGSASFGLYSSTYAYFATRNHLRLFARLPSEARRTLWPRTRRWSEAQVLRFVALGEGPASFRGLRDALRAVSSEPSYRVGADEVLRWERAWTEGRPMAPPPPAAEEGRYPLGILAAGALPAARLAARWAGRTPFLLRPPADGRGFDPAEAERYPRFRRLVVAVNVSDGTGYANCLLLARRIADRVEMVGPDRRLRPCPQEVGEAYRRERARVLRASLRTAPLFESLRRLMIR